MLSNIPKYSKTLISVSFQSNKYNNFKSQNILLSYYLIYGLNDICNALPIIDEANIKKEKKIAEYLKYKQTQL